MDADSQHLPPKDPHCPSSRLISLQSFQVFRYFNLSMQTQGQSQRVKDGQEEGSAHPPLASLLRPPLPGGFYYSCHAPGF